MSSPLISLRYTLQQRTASSESSISHILLSLACSTAVSSVPHSRWCVVITGELGPSFKERLCDAWDLASIDGYHREIWVADHQTPCHSLSELSNSSRTTLSVQLKDLSLKIQDQVDQSEADDVDVDDKTLISQQNQSSSIKVEDETEETEVFNFENILPSNQEEINTHLLILMGTSVRAQVALPSEKELNHYSSVVCISESMFAGLLNWQRWSARVGAHLLFNRDHLISELSAHIQECALGVHRAQFHLKTVQGIKLQSITALTPNTSALKVNQLGGEANFILSTPQEGRRATWLISLQESQVKREDRLLAVCLFKGEQHKIKSSSKYIKGIEFIQPAVAFAHQLSHRTRCIDSLLYSYSRQELRRVVQYLDQWLKLSIALEEPEVNEWIYQLKVKFLSVGRFDSEDLKLLIEHGFTSPYYLNLSGEWIRSPSIFSLRS